MTHASLKDPRIAEGIKEAVDWFVTNYDSARK